MGRLAFLTASRSLIAGLCPGAAGAITVQLQDAIGTAVAAGPGGQSFTASSSSAGPVAWYTDATCVTVASSGTFTIPLGSSAVSLYYVDPRAGTPTISLANASSLSNPTPQTHTVVAGAPTVLAFTTPPRTLDALTCVPQPSTVQTRDAFSNPSNVVTSLTVGLAGLPAGITPRFFATAACGATVPSVQILAGTNQASFHFNAENPGVLTVSATATGYSPLTQNHTIHFAQPTKLVLTNTAAPTEAGACTVVRVTRQDLLNRTATPANATAVTFAALPSTGLQFFSNSTCTVLAAASSIAGGTGFTDLYVKGTTGGTYALTASSAGLTDGTSSILVLPMVRRGGCSIPAGSLTATCSVTPPIPGDDISRTMMIFVASNGANNPSDGNARCQLSTGGVGGVTVSCTRSGTGGVLPVSWQTVSFAQSFANGGASVQHFSGNVIGTSVTPMVVPIASVDLTKSFVLTSFQFVGTDNGADDFATARLVSATTATLTSPDSAAWAGPGSWALQVVSMAGASVVRSSLVVGAVATVSVTGLAAATPARTFPLFSARTSLANDTLDVCKRVLRGVVTDATTLTFSRGNGTLGVCVDAPFAEVAWERVELPAGALVQSVDVSHLPNASTGTGTIATAVDLSRTVLLMASQGNGGQGGGESDFFADDILGALLGTPSLSGTTVTVTRPALNLGSARFTPYIVQLVP